MKTKRILSVILAAALAVTFAGCNTETANNPKPAENSAKFKNESEIGVITREEGSGTRSAFIELFGIEQKNENGDKIDRTIDSAVVANQTSVMMTTVAGDLYSIGYISLGSLNDTVKAVKIDGADANADNIKNGSYKISRPFNIITKGNLDEVSQDFADFILSADGQKVIADNGYISVSENGEYSGSAKGKIVIEGSSSVTPVMEKLKEAYIKKNPDVTIEIQQSDSSSGITSAIQGTCSIGMSSRDLKDSEKEKGAQSTVIATDGVAVIINKDNPTDNLTSEQVKSIFTGEAIKWSDLNG